MNPALWGFVLAMLAAEPAREFTSPGDSQPEYGYALSAAQAAEGWVSLFDGASTFGWTDGKLEGNRLAAGRSTVYFTQGDCRINVAERGILGWRGRDAMLCSANVAPGPAA